MQGEAPASYDIKQSASRKYTAPLLDTPKSVQIIPAEVMKDQAASTLTDVLRNTPDITFGAGEGGNPLGDRPFIRGYARTLAYQGNIPDAILWLRKVPATATPSFMTKVREFLAAASQPGLRDLAL